MSGMSGAMIRPDNKSFVDSSLDRGMSQDAVMLRKRLQKFFDDISETSVTLGILRRKAKSLMEISKECSLNNWDGYGALAVNQATVFQAHRFLRALPTVVPAPDIMAEPSGEVAFEWYLGPRWVLAISIDNRGELTYAGLFGSNEVHGTEYFEDELPEAIETNLYRVLSEGR